MSSGADTDPPRSVRLSPGAVLTYEAEGDGIPLIALHGAYSTRAEVLGFLEPMIASRAVKRIYVDLPGHGDSRPSDDVRAPDDVLDLLDVVLEQESPPGGPFLVLGHSFGAHFARALAARHPDRVAGVALVCAAMPGEQHPAPSHVVRDDGVSADLTPEHRDAYEAYFVVRTAETLERFEAAVLPATREVDDDTLEAAITPGPHADDPDAVRVDAPVLVVSARHDSWVGWERQERLGDRYPRATVVTAADAGHALPHERPALVAALLGEWLDGVAASIDGVAASIDGVVSPGDVGTRR